MLRVMRTKLMVIPSAIFLDNDITPAGAGNGGEYGLII